MTQHQASVETTSSTTDAVHVDLTPTWGEIGLMFVRFAESSETKALRALKPEVARAMGFAQAMKDVFPTLTKEQQASVLQTAELEAAKVMR